MRRAYRAIAPCAPFPSWLSCRNLPVADGQGRERRDRQHQRRGHTSGNYTPYSTQLFLPLSWTTAGTRTSPLCIRYVRSIGLISSPSTERAGAPRNTEVRSPSTLQASDEPYRVEYTINRINWSCRDGGQAEGARLDGHDGAVHGGYGRHDGRWCYVAGRGLFVVCLDPGPGRGRCRGHLGLQEALR